MGIHPLQDFRPEEGFRVCSPLSGSYEQTFRLGLVVRLAASTPAARIAELVAAL